MYCAVASCSHLSRSVIFTSSVHVAEGALRGLGSSGASQCWSARAYPGASEGAVVLRSILGTAVHGRTNTTVENSLIFKYSAHPVLLIRVYFSAVLVGASLRRCSRQRGRWRAARTSTPRHPWSASARSRRPAPSKRARRSATRDRSFSHAELVKLATAVALSRSCGAYTALNHYCTGARAPRRERPRGARAPVQYSCRMS